MLKEVCDICLKDIEHLERRATRTLGRQMSIEPKNKHGNKVIVFVEFRGNPDFKEDSPFDPSAICNDCLLEGIDINLNQTPAKINEGNHQHFLNEIEGLMGLDPEANSSAGKRLKYLATLVEEYEKEKFPLGKE